MVKFISTVNLLREVVVEVGMCSYLERYAAR